MYKKLIYAVVILLVGGAGYYFNRAGVPELIVSGQDKRGSGVGAAQVFSGIYECVSGCQNPSRIILEEDTTVDVITTVEGQDKSLGQGTWGVGSGGAIVMVLRKPEWVEGDYPSSVIINKASNLKLSHFSNKKPLLPGLEDPVFTRVAETPKAVENTTSESTPTEEGTQQ